MSSKRKLIVITKVMVMTIVEYRWSVKFAFMGSIGCHMDKKRKRM